MESSAVCGTQCAAGQLAGKEPCRCGSPVPAPVVARPAWGEELLRSSQSFREEGQE